MDANKDTRCSEYLGIACIDGTCPKIYRGEYIPVLEDCADCGIYEGCEGCYFKGTKYCDKKDTEFKGIIIHENTPDLYEP